MTDETKIDGQFRDRAKDWESQPAESTWEGLAGRLGEHQSGSIRRRRLAFRTAAAVGVAALLALSLYMFNTSFEAGGSYADKTEIDFPEHPVANRGTTLGETTNMDTSLMPASDETSMQDGRVSKNGMVKDIRISKYNAGPDDGRPSRTDATSGNDAFAANIESLLPPEISSQVAGPSVHEGNSTDEDAGISSSAASESSAYGDDLKLEITDAYAIRNRLSFEEEAAQSKIERSKKTQQRSAGQRESTGSEGTDTRDASEGAFYNYLSTGETEEAFTTTTLRVFVPTEKKSACRFVAFEVVDGMLYIDPCRNDRSDIQKTESLPLDRSCVLADLLRYDRDALRQFEKKAGEGPCLHSATSITIVYRTGTGLSWHEETNRIPAQEFCIPEEAQELVRELKALRDEYAE